MIAGGEQSHHGSQDRRHAGRGGDGRLSAPLQNRQALLECGDGGLVKRA